MEGHIFLLKSGSLELVHCLEWVCASPARRAACCCKGTSQSNVKTLIVVSFVAGRKKSPLTQQHLKYHEQLEFIHAGL